LQGLLLAGLLLGAWGCASTRQPGNAEAEPLAGGEPAAGPNGREPSTPTPATSAPVIVPVVTPTTPAGCGPDDDCEPDRDGDGWVAGEDCDDEDASVNPGVMEIPNNGLDDDCDGLELEVSVHPMPDDIDGDGWPAPEDCDDSNAGVNPSADEQCCDLVDNDCNPMTTDDLGFCNCIYDGDADGYDLDVDCDDQDPNVHPSAGEACDNGKDDDCDGLVDFDDGDCVIGNG